MGLIDANGIFTDVNPALCRLLDVRKSALLQRPVTAIVATQDTQTVKRLLRASKPSKKARQITLQTRSGASVPCLTTIVDIQTEDSGSIQRLLQVQTLELDYDPSAAPSKTKNTTNKTNNQAVLNSLVNHYPGIAYRCTFKDQRLLEFASAGCLRLTAYRPSELTRLKTFDAVLTHPNDLASVQEQLRIAFIREAPYNIIYRLVRKDQTEVWVRDQGQGLFANGELIGCEGFISDISDTHKMGLRLAHKATHDELTGLSNRRSFEQRIEQALAHAKVHGHVHTLCYLDLDQFKIINDSVGHQAGDELLKHVAVLLRSKVRETDVVARLGGDEFGLLLNHCPLERGQAIATKLVQEINVMRFPWQQSLFEVSASIGLVEINPHNDNAVGLMSQADVACYAAKDLGRNRLHVYQSQDVELLKRHADILRVSSLRQALEQDHFRLYCQPIKQLSTQPKHSKYYEVLLRLADPNGNIILPGAFIPAAERFGLMGDVDRWVIGKVLESYERFFQGDRNIRFAINLSGVSLSDPQLINYIHGLLQKSSLWPNQLCFEITETAAVRNMQSAMDFIKQGRELGCQFALDDFGSGLSSFAYLKYFPVNYLKIDGSFVRDMVTERNDRVLVAAINEIGHIMGMQTVAEWVESDEVIESLRALEVDYVQGSAIGKPIPFDRTAVVGL